VTTGLAVRLRECPRAPGEGQQSEAEQYEEHKGRAARSRRGPDGEDESERENDAEAVGEASVGRANLDDERQRMETHCGCDRSREGNHCDPTLKRERLTRCWIVAHPHRLPDRASRGEYRAAVMASPSRRVGPRSLQKHDVFSRLYGPETVGCRLRWREGDSFPAFCAKLIKKISRGVRVEIRNYDDLEPILPLHDLHHTMESAPISGYGFAIPRSPRLRDPAGTSSTAIHPCVSAHTRRCPRPNRTRGRSPR